MNLRTLTLWTLGMLLAAVVPAQAQIKASERGGVHQTIDGTTITIDYARPRARGRAPYRESGQRLYSLRISGLGKN